MKSSRYQFVAKALFLICVIGSFYSNANPPAIPTDPYSDASYLVTKQYFGIADKQPQFRVLEVVNTLEENSYILQKVRIQVESWPVIELVLKLPRVFTPPLSAVVLFTGFQTGSQSVSLVGDPDNRIYIGFQYPWPIDFRNNSVVWDWHRMEMLPLYMSVALRWVYAQPFIDAHRVNIVNVSFGTLFYPLAQRILNEIDLYPQSVVFGYGGADISEVVGHHWQNKLGSVELSLLKQWTHLQVWFVEPKYHISHLRGPFLVVNGENDTVFPNISRNDLIGGLNGPRKVVTLLGPHIQPEEKEVIRNFLNEVAKFYAEQGI